MITAILLLLAQQIVGPFTVSAPDQATAINQIRDAYVLTGADWSQFGITLTPPPEPPDPSVGFVIDHTSLHQFDGIPESYIAAASNLTVKFWHASVGANIDLALDCLQYDIFPDLGRRPNSCFEFNDPKYDRFNWAFEFHNPQPAINPPWWDKLNLFQQRVPNESAEVVMYKHGYVDAFSGSDIYKFWDRIPSDSKGGIEEIEALIAANPTKRIVLWTISLARASTYEMEQFNLQMRAYAQSNPSIVLFDIGDIHSHRPDGTKCYDASGAYEAICTDYTTETNGGHISTRLGRERIAKAFWILMARLAGY